MSEDMREAFERWHDGLFDISATTVVKNEYGYPQNAVIQMRWQTWQAATASTEAKWRGVVEKATALCDQMARDGYQNAKLEAVRELREALVQAEKLMGRKQ